jgi:hypothetical protein
MAMLVEVTARSCKNANRTHLPQGGVAKEKTISKISMLAPRTMPDPEPPC